MGPRRRKGAWVCLAYVALAALGLGNGGCLLVAAGVAGGAAAGVAYWNGKVPEYFNANLDDAWAACRTALGELGMPVVGEERDAEGGCIESRTADGDKVRVSLQVVGSKIPAEGPLTRVAVRVGVFGDHPVSHRILGQVSAHLVAVPGPQPAPEPPTLHPPQPIQQTSAPPQTSPPPLAK
jgi:hypothetical protein